MSAFGTTSEISLCVDTSKKVVKNLEDISTPYGNTYIKDSEHRFKCLKHNLGTAGAKYSLILSYIILGGQILMINFVG